MVLSKVQIDGKTVIIDIINKLSYLTNGKSVTGYHKLRQQHLEGAIQIDYIDLLDLYKKSKDDQDFDQQLLRLIKK